MSAVRVIGLHELRLALVAAGREAPDAIAEASTAGAELIAGEARTRAPAGPHEGGGRVAPIRSTIRAGRQGLAGVVSMGGPSAPHAEVVNFGGSIPRAGADKAVVARARQQHRSYERAGITKRTKVVRREFLYSAIGAKEDEVVELYADAAEKVLGRAFPS